MGICVMRNMRRLVWICSLMLPAAFAAAGCTSQSAPIQPARHRATTIASPLKVISYHGVHLRVPTAWPVIDAMHAPWCGGPFPVTPTVYLGSHGTLDPSCPPTLPGSPSHDGAWLQAGSPPADARPVVLAGGTVVREERVTGPWQDRLVQLWYHGVLVEIGIGPNRKASNEIVRSVSYTPGQPDTKTADICPRRVGPASMPAPQRLGRRLAADLGDITMTPPLRSDQPVMRAALAWRDSGPKSVFERYRLLLVRYSSKYPAIPSSPAAPVPADHRVLAWVVYSEPFSTAAAGCGSWGVYAFDATTSQGMVDSSWSLGP
jgi:hypothetical protein